MRLSYDAVNSALNCSLLRTTAALMLALSLLYGAGCSRKNESAALQDPPCSVTLDKEDLEKGTPNSVLAQEGAICFQNGEEVMTAVVGDLSAWDVRVKSNRVIFAKKNGGATLLVVQTSQGTYNVALSGK